MLASIVMSANLNVNAQDTLDTQPHGGTPGAPIWGPLPANVTPDVTVPTTAYLSFSPNPVGLNQLFLVNVWVTPGIHRSRYHTGYTVNITKPDGTSVTVGPMNSYYGDGTAWFEYPADQIGTWKLSFSFAGGYYPQGFYNDSGWPATFGTTQTFFNYSMWYQPSNTAEQTLTVQEAQVASWPLNPLPNDYWTRPVNTMNRGWAASVGDFPWSGAIYEPSGRVLYSSNYKYTPYVAAPNTAHVVWRNQTVFGGLFGAGQGYQASTGTGFGGVPQPTLVFQGRAYGTYSKPGTGTTSVTYFYCMNLRTGQLIWEYPVATTVTFSLFGPMTTPIAPTCISYLNTAETGSQEVPGATSRAGASAALVYIGDRLIKFDPFTGAISSNVSSGAEFNCTIQGSGGGLFGGGGSTIYSDPYALSIQTLVNGGVTSYRLINWTTAPTADNFTARVLNNITWPMSSLGTADFDAGISATVNWDDGVNALGTRVIILSMKDGSVTANFSTAHTPAETLFSGATLVVDHGKVAFAAMDRHWLCYNPQGQKVWQSEDADYPWGTWWAYATASYEINSNTSAIIGTNYAGVYAIDWDTGKIIWWYYDPTVAFESPYITSNGTTINSFDTGVQIADGKIYVYNTEHTPTAPINRGWKLHCINATTGQGIWSISTPGSLGVIADGYMTAGSIFDGYTYCFGRGPSSTSLTTLGSSVNGSSVLIQGKVLDQSPAQPGTPCVSAASMATQMEYLHMQQPLAGLFGNATITGVPVTLMATDPNGNTITIGTTTTNGYYGTFSFAWTPSMPGPYTIFAYFAGDDSYGGSTASTDLNVNEAPQGTQISTGGQIQSGESPLLMYTLIGVIVLIILVIVAIVVLAVRRR